MITNKLVCSPEDYRYNLYRNRDELLVSLGRVEGIITRIYTAALDTTCTIVIKTDDYDLVSYEVPLADADLMKVNVGTSIALYFLEGKPVTEYYFKRSK